MLMDTVFDAFMATAKAAPDYSFLCAPPSPGRAYHPAGVEYTYAQVRAEALALRARYASAGYGHGHRVGLLFENRPEFFFHYLALNALGAGVVRCSSAIPTCASPSARAASAGCPTRSTAWTSSGRTASTISGSR